MVSTAQLFSLFAFFDYLIFFSIWLFCHYLKLLECYSSITRVTVTRVKVTRVTLFSLLYSVTRITLFPLLYSNFRVTLFVTRVQLCMPRTYVFVSDNPLSNVSYPVFLTLSLYSTIDLCVHCASKVKKTSLSGGGG